MCNIQPRVKINKPEHMQICEVAPYTSDISAKYQLAQWPLAHFLSSKNEAIPLPVSPDHYRNMPCGASNSFMLLLYLYYGSA